jgi:D-alanine-D-alanine ligase
MALPVTRIIPDKKEFYNYESKYEENGSRHIVPANIDSQLTKLIQDCTVKAHEIIGCRDISRSDFIVKDGQAYIMEINTIPGMTQTSLFPEAAKVAGIEFPGLLNNIITYANKKRRGQNG